MEIPFWRAPCVCMFACVCACVCYPVLGCMDGDNGGGNTPLQAGSQPQWEGGMWTCGCAGPCRMPPLLWPGQLCFRRVLSAVDHHILTYRVGTDNMTAPELYRALPGSSHVMREFCHLRQATQLSEPQFPYPKVEVTG